MQSEPLTPTLRSILRRDVLWVCVVIFLADVVWSVLSPTFSLFAQGLGASLFVIGVLNALTGCTQFLAAVPVGIRSDVWGRRAIITLGGLVMALACVAHATAVSSYMLGLARVLFALGTVMLFPTGTVLMADITQPSERGMAFGLLTTAMSFGATVGAYAASWMEPRIGIPGSYWAAAGVGLLCAVLAFVLLPGRTLSPKGERPQPLNLLQILPLMGNPAVAFGALINFCVSTCFAGVIMAYFPILAVARGATSAEVSTYFSIRSLGSMFTRLPLGVLSMRLPGTLILGVALAVDAVLLLGMGATASPVLMAGLLVIEGVAFGANLTVGQASIAQHVSEHERAGAISLYSTAGSLGATLSPLVLGALAEFAGVPVLFYAVAVNSILSLVMGAFMLRRATRAPA